MNTTKRVNTEVEARRLAAKAKQNAAYWANKKRSEKALAEIKKKHEKKQKNETKEQAEKRIKKETKMRKMQNKIKQNAFAVLCSDTESDSELEETPVKGDTAVESIPKNTWAGLVKGEFKVEPKPQTTPTTTPTTTKPTTNTPTTTKPKLIVSLSKPAPWANAQSTCGATKKSWAEMCDEDSSDDEDDIYTGNDAWDD